MLLAIISLCTTKNNIGTARLFNSFILNCHHFRFWTVGFAKLDNIFGKKCAVTLFPVVNHFMIARYSKQRYMLQNTAICCLRVSCMRSALVPLCTVINNSLNSVKKAILF
jgi:hypothetical protein